MNLFLHGIFYLGLAGSLLVPTLPVRATSLGLPAPAYDSKGDPYSSKYYRKQPSGISVSLNRKEGLSPGQFVLSLMAKDSVTGCMKMSDLNYTSAFKDIALDIEVSDYTVDLRDLPSAPQYACDQRYKAPKAEIILNKTDLMDRKTRVIRLKSGLFTNTYDVTLTGDYIQLIPSQTEVGVGNMHKPQKISSVKNALKLWFYPENTLVLSVPDAGPDSDVRAEVDRFAALNGLSPLESVIPGFSSPVTTPHTFYYVDKNGQFSSNSAITDGIVAGNIAVAETVYELAGDRVEQKPVPVYARSPGLHD